MRQTTKEAMGKPVSSADGTRWMELAELLATEFRIAAARTTFSSVPAFLTEHLRRRLWKIEKQQMEGREPRRKSLPAGQQTPANARTVAGLGGGIRRVSAAESPDVCTNVSRKRIELASWPLKPVSTLSTSVRQPRTGFVMSAECYSVLCKSVTGDALSALCRWLIKSRSLVRRA